MPGLEPLLLVAGALAVAGLAAKFGRSSPLVLVVVGLGVSYIPGMPDFQIQPDLVLVLFLPPLVYSAALDSSYLGFRAKLRPIALLAVVLVLVTTVTVGFVAHWLIPDLPLASALVLGAVISPPDAVAAASIGRKLGLPRRVMTVLSGESLVNDATALTAFKVAIAAAVGAATSWGEGILTFFIASVGGVLVGLVLGWIVHQIRLRLADDVVESALGIVVPFACYVLAEAVHGSGVLAVVAAGLYLGHFAPYAGFATRLQETVVWRSFDVLLESLVFALIGLNFRYVFTQAAAGGHPAASLVWPIIAVLLATMLVRLVWVFPTTSLPHWIRARTHGDPDEKRSWRSIAVIAWSGMRGVVSLAAAAAVPESVPGRDVVLLLAFTVTVGTLLIQGTTLPLLIRVLGVHGTEESTDALAEAQAAHNAAMAAVARLEELDADASVDTPREVIERLRDLAERRGNAAWERLGRQELESPTASFRRLRLETLAAERAVYVAARDNGEIDDEVLRRVLRELDLEQARLVTRD
ncbi:MAG TPA: Na+/H+ antiporter [Pseudonocardiaceae bacterium]|nr:Na+/H+ antiporter [Pseudonocardiaceae bacterium]